MGAESHRGDFMLASPLETTRYAEYVGGRFLGLGHSGPSEAAILET